MTNPIDTIAAQRDELAAKLRSTGQQLTAAQAEIERLKALIAAHSIAAKEAPPVPAARPRLFGNKAPRGQS